MDVCDERSVYRAAEFVGEALVEGKSGEGWLEGGEEEGEEKGRQPQHQQQQHQQQRKTGGGRGGGEGQGEAIAALLGGGTSSSRKNGSGSLPLRLLRSRGGGSGSGSGSGGIRGGSETPQPVRRRRQRAPSHVALLAGLVNCAGVAVPGPLLHQPLSEIRRQMEVNFFGACCVTQAFAPLLGAGRGERTEEKREAGVDTGCEDASSSPPSSSSSAFSSSSPPFSRFAASSFPVSNPGTIVQISSTAGKLSAPFIGAYAASKHALEAASDALRRELVPYGCDLLVLEPGAVATPVWDKAEGHDVSAYDGTPYKGPLKVFGEIVRAEGRVSFFDVFFLLLQTKKFKKTQKNSLSLFEFLHLEKIKKRFPEQAGHTPQRIAGIVADLLDRTQKKKQKRSLFLSSLPSPLSLLLSAPPPTRTTCVYRRVKNWTLPRLLPDRLSDLAVAAVLGMLPGPFFRNANAGAPASAAPAAGEKEKASASAAAAAADAAADAAAAAKESSSSEQQLQQQQLFSARCAVAAAAFVAAMISFAWRVAAAP